MANPILTCSVRDVNSQTIALTGYDTMLIRYFSDAKATFSAKAQGGTSINEDMYIIRNGSETGYGTEYTFEDVESNVFTFSAEDSEGNIGTKTVTPTMVEYIKLTCNVVESKVDAAGGITLTCYGDFYNDGFGQVVNTLSVKYSYREKGGTWSSEIAMTLDIVGNKYYAYASLTGLDYQKTYEFIFSAEDALMTKMTAMSNVKSVPVFHWSEDDVTFEVPVTFKKGLTDSSAESLPDSAYGTWTPAIDDAVVSYYDNQSGWYSKSGNVVTVGFYIKARCVAEEYVESASIAIWGLPYAPIASSAGGGMCSGALMVSDQNFQCFVAGTDGSITTIAQACGSTSGIFLQTSDTGCNYPAGGLLTLSGTITYMTEE